MKKLPDTLWILLWALLLTQCTTCANVENVQRRLQVIEQRSK